MDDTHFIMDVDMTKVLLDDFRMASGLKLQRKKLQLDGWLMVKDQSTQINSNGHGIKPTN